MANIKDLKKKIKGTKSTLKITTAMKLVSAAKLAKAQQAITSSRPYAEEMEKSIKEISALVDNYTHSYFHENESKKNILLVISADKGLCGGYNSSIAKNIRKFLANTDEEFELAFVGKKAKEMLNKDGLNFGQHYSFEKSEPSFLEIKAIAEELAGRFSEGEVGKVYVCYNKFLSAISFDTTIKQILPMTVDQEESKELAEKYPFDFKYEPAPKEILDSLIPQAYIATVYTSLLDGVAAEHGSRMAAMDSAVSNCKDVIRTLTLKMNKLRQAAITTELIEVVSGAESLNA